MDPEDEIVPQLEKPEAVLVQDTQQRLEHATATIEMLEKQVRQQARRLARQRTRIEEQDTELSRRRRPLGRIIRPGTGSD
jgi:septal ring factor EnvC (AmiA/AmiB activator)